jgi:alpha-L-fucosidase
MRENGESIYGCGKAGLPKPDCGRFTRRGNTVYLHVYENSIGPLPLPQLRKEQIRSVSFLANGCEIAISTSWVHSDYPDVCFLDLGPDPVLPDPVDTVVKIVLKEEV